MKNERKTSTEKEQAEKDKLYAEIFKKAKLSKTNNKLLPEVPTLKVYGKNPKKILCKAYLIGGDIMFVYGTGRVEMVLAMKYKLLGDKIQVISKEYQLVDKGINQQNFGGLDDFK